MLDSLSRHPPGSQFAADLCIVGGGPAGLAIAREFAGGAARVLLVESGGETPRAADQRLNAGEATGASFRGIELGRTRAFGGTAWTWSGQCVPLEPEVFERRAWVPGTGWPIGAAVTPPYAQRAAEFLGADLDVESEPWSRRRIPRPDFDPGKLDVRTSAFAAPLNPGPRELAALRRSRSVTALLHATVTGLRLSASGEIVEEAEVATLAGDRSRIRARAFILCCGAIENARLLLLSGDLEDRLPAVGRYFQDHLLTRPAELEPLNRRQLHDRFASVGVRRRHYLRRLVLAREQQHRDRVLACHGYVGWQPPRSGPAMRALVARSQPPLVRARQAATVVRDLPELSSAVLRRARGLSSAPRQGAAWLDVRSEQAPDPDSRVALGRRTDPLGLPQPSITWRFGEAERRTIAAFVATAGAELERLGLAVVRPASWLDDPDAWSGHVVDAFHHMGTTRMSEDARDGVVDASCRVHGVRNLYIAGSSVFPASGAANPTLGLVAIAIRLADHLRRSQLSK